MYWHTDCLNAFQRWPCKEAIWRYNMCFIACCGDFAIFPTSHWIRRYGVHNVLLVFRSEWYLFVCVTLQNYFLFNFIGVTAGLRVKDSSVIFIIAVCNTKQIYFHMHLTVNMPQMIYLRHLFLEPSAYDYKLITLIISHCSYLQNIFILFTLFQRPRPIDHVIQKLTC